MIAGRILRIFGIGVIIGVGGYLAIQGLIGFDIELLDFRFNSYILPTVVAVGLLTYLFGRVVVQPAKLPYTFPFLLFLMALIWWGITEILQRLGATSVSATFWSSLSPLGTALVPLAFLLFSYNYTNRPKSLSSGLMVVVAVIMTGMFMFLMLTTELVTTNDAANVLSEKWGYINPAGPFLTAFTAWFLGMFALSLGWLFEYSKNSVHTSERQQTKIIIWGVIIPLLGGAFSDGVAPILGVHFLPLAVSLTAITALSVGYAITRYKTFRVDIGAAGKEVISFLPNPIIVISPSESITFINKSARQLFNITTTAMTNGTIWDYCRDEEFVRICQNSILPILRSNKETATVDHPVVIEQGEERRRFEIIGSLIKDDSEEVTGYAIVLTDIEKIQEITGMVVEKTASLEKTKRALLNILADEKILQETLIQERDRATTIISSMGEGLILIDSDFKITKLNLAAQKLLGVTEKTALGQKWDSLIKAYEGDKRIKFEERSAYIVMKTGRPITIKLEDNHFFEPVEGKRFPVVSTTTTYQEGDERGVIVVFRDATKERNVLERIEKEVVERTHDAQEARARLISSINSLTIGFIMTDLNQNIVLINDAAINSFKSLTVVGGESKDQTGEIPVVTIDSITLRLQGQAQLVKKIADCIKTQQTVSIENINVNNRDIEIHISPIVFERNVIGVVMLVVDVTDEKQLARSKDDFLSIASHELRTPLTAIMGNADMINTYFAEEIKNKDLREMIVDMKTASTRMIDLVNDFLNVSRLEQGRISFKPEKMSLKKCVDEVVTQLSANLKPGLKLLSGTPADVTVYADPFRVKEVVTNLIGNGIKYTPKGTVEIGWELAKDRVVVRVKDTGIGIAVENRSILFQKFRQAGTSTITRDSSRSSGLGLYISRLLISAMGGEIGLENSTPDKGSIFYFTLPLEKSQHLTKTK